MCLGGGLDFGGLTGIKVTRCNRMTLGVYACAFVWIQAKEDRSTFFFFG